MADTGGTPFAMPYLIYVPSTYRTGILEHRILVLLKIGGSLKFGLGRMRLTTAVLTLTTPTDHLQLKICQIAILSKKISMGIDLI